MCLLSLAMPGLHAQTEELPDGAAIGMTVDQFGIDGNGVTAVSFRHSSLRAASAGTEIGVGLFPQALVAGALLLAPDVGASYNVPLPGATLLAKAGMSMLMGVGGGLAVLPGVHLGGGVIFRVQERLAVRVDLIRHFYRIEGETVPIWRLGVGFAVLPVRRE